MIIRIIKYKFYSSPKTLGCEELHQNQEDERSRQHYNKHNTRKIIRGVQSTLQYIQPGYNQ